MFVIRNIFCADLWILLENISHEGFLFLSLPELTGVYFFTFV